MTNAPSEYRFDEIQLGLEHEFTEKITESYLEQFANLSGDHNPLHMDENYAKTTQFNKRVCHGMLLASFFSKLVGMHIPGKNALYFSQTLNFQNPCFVGDTVKVYGQVVDKSESTKILTIKTAIYNQAGICLIDGIAKVMLRTN